jgi:hypothetical protein
VSLPDSDFVRVQKLVTLSYLCAIVKMQEFFAVGTAVACGTDFHAPALLLPNSEVAGVRGDLMNSPVALSSAP